MASNILRNPILDVEKTLGVTRFLGADFKKHYNDGKDTGKLSRLEIRVISVANRGENLIKIPLVETVEIEGERQYQYVAASVVQALKEKVDAMEMDDIVELIDVMATPRANKIDNQDISFIRAELDWNITAKDIKLIKKADGSTPKPSTPQAGNKPNGN